MIPFKLDYVIELALQEQPSAEQIVLKKLAGAKLSKNEASVAWERILDHKWYVSEKLGRDIGFRVAAIDYFENIYSKNKQNRNQTKHNSLFKSLNPATQSM